MARFFFRHWTGIAIIAAIFGWALIYLPGSPSIAVFQLKRAIDARDAEVAARFVDFDSVVRNAGREIVNGEPGINIFNRMLGEGAVALLSQPMANAARAWAMREVQAGAQEVQMPAVAVAAAVVLLHRSGNSAFTKFRDHDGQIWEIQMARNGDGQWQIVEVKNIRQILRRLQQQQPKPFGEYH
jgi:hypothetical protein